MDISDIIPALERLVDYCHDADCFKCPLFSEADKTCKVREGIPQDWKL